MAATDRPVRTGDDPTKAVLSKSKLWKKDLQDYVINVAMGCRHDCAFCYVPSTPTIRTRPDVLADAADVEEPLAEWGTYVLHRDAEVVAKRLASTLENKRQWRYTPVHGRGIVALSFSTDCYQDRLTADVTRACIRELAIKREYRVRVLTRNPILALQDMDLYREAAESNRVTIGSSIPSLNAEKVAAIERRAPAPGMRLSGLKEFSEAGVPVFVSMSPTYPTHTRADMYDLIRTFRDELPTLDVVFHEPINGRGKYRKRTVMAAIHAGEHELAAKVDNLKDRRYWRRYAVRQFRWVEEAADDFGVPVKLWPDKELRDAVAETADGDWVRGHYRLPSPENFACGGDA